jgi:molybdopterin molybdotransferase
VGEADFVTETLDRIGEVGFWTVAIKPGRPIAFGRVAGALFFGLPGNPVSVMVTFYQLVQPALQRLKGLAVPAMRRPASAQRWLAAEEETGTTGIPARRVARRRRTASYRVEAAGRQGSGILRSMAHANCFIVLPEDCGSLEPGATVQVQPFAALC